MGFYFCKEKRCEFRKVSDRTYLLYQQCSNVENVKSFTTKTKCNSCDKIFSETHYHCDEHRKLINPITYDKCYECKSQIWMSENILKESEKLEE